MQPPTYDEFIKTTGRGYAYAGRASEKIYIERCPTPGCGCGRIRPLTQAGKIVGFTCSYGCQYVAHRNELTCSIDYFELVSFDLRYIDIKYEGFTITPIGIPKASWV
jgi:hypothetical protein